jgi:phosphoadenosine phosphosulfate reductase
VNAPVAAESRTRIREDSPTPELIAWSLERFSHLNMVMTTSFGMEGCALIDMYARHGRPLTVVYLDTMFFFPETYELCARMAGRYPHLTFENRGTVLTPDQQAERYGPELWKTNPDLCCRLRKVEPMWEAMAGVDVWITGLRRSQSVARAKLRVIEWDWKFQVLKINPLAHWERPQVWEYIQANNVPYNALHERGYPSVGCTHCTSPVPGASVTDYTRVGRWNGASKTECGLHGDGI